MSTRRYVLPTIKAGRRVLAPSGLLKGGYHVLGVLVSAHRPEALDDAMYSGNLVATYADLITPAVAERFAGRLLSIDRGEGDPLVRAQVVDFRGGGYTMARGIRRLSEFRSQLRPFVTAYVDQEDWPELRERTWNGGPLYWVATRGGVLNPDGRYPAVVQFAGEFTIGRNVQFSLIYDYGLARLGHRSPGQWVPQGPVSQYEGSGAGEMVRGLLGEVSDG